MSFTFHLIPELLSLSLLHAWQTLYSTTAHTKLTVIIPSLAAQRSKFSQRLINTKCSTEYHRSSFLPVTRKLYNSYDHCPSLSILQRRGTGSDHNHYFSIIIIFLFYYFTLLFYYSPLHYIPHWTITDLFHLSLSFLCSCVIFVFFCVVEELSGSTIKICIYLL